MPEYNSITFTSSVPQHTHLQDDIINMPDWQSAIERSQAAHAKDIEALKKGFIVLILIVCVLAMLLLVVV